MRRAFRLRGDVQAHVLQKKDLNFNNMIRMYPIDGFAASITNWDRCQRRIVSNL
jgi:hypothetical protein